jgi:CheY-like chemotaxis protein
VPAATGTAAGEQHQVLLVEDEPTVAEATRLMLESLGHQVQVCEDAQAGVEAYAADPAAFDVVLMDLTTPRLSASDALARILEANPKARVILCSGYSMGAETQRLLEAGAEAFLRKPYRLEQLEAVLSRAC